jgi:hypothetical protein
MKAQLAPLVEQAWMSLHLIVSSDHPADKAAARVTPASHLLT